MSAEVTCPECDAGEQELELLYDNEDGTALWLCTACGTRFADDA